MSIDVLQEKIRKKKNPSLIQLEAFSELIPESILSSNSTLAAACTEYYRALLEGMKDVGPAVRLDWGSFALLGAEGLRAMEDISKAAHDQGYYVVTDIPELLLLPVPQHLLQTLRLRFHTLHRPRVITISSFLHLMQTIMQSLPIQFVQVPVSYRQTAQMNLTKIILLFRSVLLRIHIFMPSI